MDFSLPTIYLGNALFGGQYLIPGSVTTFLQYRTSLNLALILNHYSLFVNFPEIEKIYSTVTDTVMLVHRCCPWILYSTISVAVLCLSGSSTLLSVLRFCVYLDPPLYYQCCGFVFIWILHSTISVAVLCLPGSSTLLSVLRFCVYLTWDRLFSSTCQSKQNTTIPSIFVPPKKRFFLRFSL